MAERSGIEQPKLPHAGYLYLGHHRRGCHVTTTFLPHNHLNRECDVDATYAHALRNNSRGLARTGRQFSCLGTSWWSIWCISLSRYWVSHLVSAQTDSTASDWGRPWFLMVVNCLSVLCSEVGVSDVLQNRETKQRAAGRYRELSNLEMREN